MKVLYVEDNLELAETVSLKLQKLFYVDNVVTCEGGYQKAECCSYDLIILDYFLPDDTGLELCHKIRSINSEVLILFLTQNDSHKDIVEALDAGADDYLTKPFHFDELLARIQALLRRKQFDFIDHIISCGEFRLNQKNFELTYMKLPVVLKRKEFKIFEYMMRHYMQIIPRYRLYEHVWEKPYYVSNTIDVHIKRLRSKIENSFGVQHIETIYGVGYRLSKRNLLEK